MSVSKQWVTNPDNQNSVLSLYRGHALYTIEKIAEVLGTTFHNVGYVIGHCLPPDERKALARLRYSASKTGTKNPMKGKCGEQHHNWKGECDDGNGYLTCIHNGERQFVHRVVMAQAVGVPKITDELVVHHIDGDKTNNDLDNLALVTKAGHKAVHYMQSKDSKALQLKKTSIADAVTAILANDQQARSGTNRV